MAPDTGSPIELGRSDGHLASIVYIAHTRGHLDRLDELLQKYSIEERGCSEFLGRLRENWLVLPQHRRRKAAQGSFSALSELLAAEYLESRGFVIENLAAWDNRSADILCKHRETSIGFEVKLLVDSPELEQLRIDSMAGSGVSVSSVSNPATNLNYFYSRLAEAVVQNDAAPSVGPAGVFFVFGHLAESQRNAFINSVSGGFDWYTDGTGAYPGVPSDSIELATSRQPHDWLNAARPFYAGTFDESFGPLQLQLALE